MRKILLFTFSLFAMLSISSCGVKTIYNQLDWYLPSIAEDFISLDPSQQSSLEKSIAELLRWHRTTQLPQYAQALRKIRSDLNNGLSEEKAGMILTELERYWVDVLDRMAPDAAELLITATETQQQELKDSFAEKNEEYEEEYISVAEDERLENIVDDLTENFERWLGPLTDEQKLIVVQGVNKFIPVHVERLSYRKVWQSRLINAMEMKNTTQAKRDIISLLSEPKKHRPQTLKDKLNINRILSTRLFLEINNLMTAEQQAHLNEEIEYYATSFEELAKETR